MAAKKVEEKKVRTKSEIVKEMQNINDAAFAKRKLLVEERKKNAAAKANKDKPKRGSSLGRVSGLQRLQGFYKQPNER
jgi:hypothetical protein